MRMVNLGEVCWVSISGCMVFWNGLVVDVVVFRGNRIISF